jgi:hypothetical protein
VHTIGGDYVESERAFDQCVPGCPEGGVLDWMLGQCKTLEARADLTDFRRGLAGKIREMLDNIREYPRSDIARTLSGTTSTINQSMADQTERTLASVFVFSDLIENSKILSWPNIIKLSADEAFDRFVGAGVPGARRCGTTRRCARS